MPLINCKVELKLKQKKYCLFSGGNDDANANHDNIIFTIKGAILYIPIVTASDNQKLSKPLSKGFERSVCLNEYKTKSDNKDTTNEFTYLLESKFVGVNRLYFQFMQMEMLLLEDLKLKDINYRKELLIIIQSSSMEKSFMINQLTRWILNCWMFIRL